MPANDPTLLFTAAGMAPFKAEFAGLAKPVSSRIATCQKCLRADDIGKVGHTARHHTFFEMLGNFSFGDYFKNEAIAWAWELLARHYKLPLEKLWVSVHTEDDEAYEIWLKKIGLPKEKLFRFSDNFWGPIGKTGTCGPDSEIYFDRGTAFSCGKPDCRPGCENTGAKGEPCDRFLELWNLVFTMYHKDENGKLHDLPKKNIDTGAGLERITMILQGADSPFETDLFKGVVAVLNPDYPGSGKSVRVATRIVADHVRAMTFMIADGVAPSNEGRGYVLQKILRRAFLNRKEIPNAGSLRDAAAVLVTEMNPVYPELGDKKNAIQFYIDCAEEEFQKILDSINNLLTPEIGFSKGIMPGPMLFKLHDERGLPFEFAKDFLESKGYRVDEDGFKAEMEKQRVRSRGSKQAVDVMSQALKTQSNAFPATKFLGYRQTEAQVRVLAVLREGNHKRELNPGDEGLVLLEESPFYAENGGQVGDTGKLSWEGGSAQVMDTQKNEGDVFLHKINPTQGTLKAGMLIRAEVNRERRIQIRKHHTATHLLHAALRAVLGPHVQQAGSFVCDEYLRLDFSHPRRVTEDELLTLEALVNRKIYENLPVETRVTSPQEAKKQGALAFFGEKYGNQVRMVSVNKFSKELCGGTHAAATGDLGPFVILKESSIAKGMRRIEAKTGKAAVDFLEKLQRLRFLLTDRLKADLDEIPGQLDAVLSDRGNMQKEIVRLKQQLANQESPLIPRKEVTYGHVKLVDLRATGTYDRTTLRGMMDTLKGKENSAVLLLSSSDGDKTNLVCGITPDLLDKGFSAAEMLKSALAKTGGRGGGKSDLAEAGGIDPSKLGEVFPVFKEMIEAKARFERGKT